MQIRRFWHLLTELQQIELQCEGHLVLIPISLTYSVINPSIGTHVRQGNWDQGVEISALRLSSMIFR